MYKLTNYQGDFQNRLCVNPQKYKDSTFIKKRYKRRVTFWTTF